MNLHYVSGEYGKSKEQQTAPLELDVDDVNDVINALKRIGFQKYIVMEDFHYLPTETQRDFSVALKAFHEASDLCFVIVGVWLEENRLIVYNGDLTGRIVSVDADTWSPSQLKEVVKAGEYLLNVCFDNTFVTQLVDGCSNSVYIVQEACYQVCIAQGIERTCENTTQVGEGVDVTALIKSVVDQQSGRHKSFLTQFADGFQDTELQMYRWLLYPVLSSSPDEVANGMRIKQLRESITSKHPRGEDLNPGNLTQALQSTASLQVKKDIKPIILDYDQTNVRLNVVDKSFLIWLRFQDRSDLLEMVDLPPARRSGEPSRAPKDAS